MVILTVMASAPPFHTWLDSKLHDAPRGTIQTVSRAVGCNPQYLSLTRRRRQYPHPQRMERLGNYFGVPPEWITQWNAEAIEHWGDNADIQLSLAGLRKAERLPCADCNQTIYKSDWKKGARRCPDCQRKRGRGAPQRRSPRNPLAQYLLSRMKQRGMNGHQLSLGVGRNGDWFGTAMRRETWRPARANLKAVARLLDDDVDNLIRVAGGTREAFLQLQGKRVQILRLATQIDRTGGDGHECYETIRPIIEASDANETLDHIRDTLLAEQRTPNPEGLRKGAAKLRGRTRPAEVGAKITESKRRSWQALSPDERRKRTTHLQAAATRIRSGIARYGHDRVIANLDTYIEQAAAYTQLPVAAARVIVRDVVGLSQGGRPSKHPHPEICEARRGHATWTELGGDGTRIAHQRWHMRQGTPSCSPP